MFVMDVAVRGLRMSGCFVQLSHVAHILRCLNCSLRKILFHMLLSKVVRETSKSSEMWRKIIATVKQSASKAVVIERCGIFIVSLKVKELDVVNDIR